MHSVHILYGDASFSAPYPALETVSNALEARGTSSGHQSAQRPNFRPLVRGFLGGQEHAPARADAPRSMVPFKAVPVP